MKKIKKWLAAIFALLMLLSAATVNSTDVQAAKTPKATDNYLKKVKQKGKLVMGTSPDYPPFEFVKNQHGKSGVVGIDVEVGKKIAKDMGVKLVIKTMDFDSLLVGLETGKVDMVIAGMTRTPKRAKSVDFSEVYENSGQELIIRKADAKKYHSYHSFAGKTIGAQTGSLQTDLIKEQAKKVKLKTMDKDNDLVLALKTNKFDAVAVDKETAEAFSQNTAGLTHIPAGFKTGDMGKAVAFHQGAQSLVNAANKSIEQIKADKLIQKQYLPKVSKYLTTGKSKKATKSSNSMWAYKDFFFAGVGYTLFISAISVFFGFLLGAVLALMRLSHNKVAHSIATAYIEFVRGTPLMVQLLFIYFGLGLIVNIPALLSGIIAVSLNSAAYVAEVIRSGINSVSVGQTEASRSLGLSRSATMRYVIMPQAMKNIWPALGNEFVSLIKESSIVSVIGVKDLIYQSRIVQADTYRGVMPLVITMILYFIITFSLSSLMKIFERKMNHD
ncbi:ABC transporter substrate-binding protein/permease [Lactobacillus sp. ESL0684]|uniref:ABC transporter substrate-binding protein/permease n=1 Tax=unclassified Lactobacillus TaxID=2620435 RepID=UPI0023F9082D|nr:MULTISPECIES: ABC transporter substrate-binding protein/permease [unclassified Lactobacillus]WEV39520.1 ABC transporter substrate-binding protein/permease [Lactobacillus sp. ESL0681]WEV43965.1 ABC transporter substrate-binding protein/permease [Lactobacillus sp. ESL0684]